MTENYLKISEISDFDNGTYVVRADNGIQSGSSHPNHKSEAVFHLMVYPLFPTIKIDMGKTLYKPGENIVVPCEITAYPPPNIAWFKVTYDRGRRNWIEIDSTKTEAYQIGLVTTMSQLMIPNSNFDDSGSYKCEATSEYFENPVSATEGISVNDGPSSSCTDSPAYSHCDKIVEHKYCGNKYFAKYCCLSCTRAGFAPGGVL